MPVTVLEKNTLKMKIKTCHKVISHLKLARLQGKFRSVAPKTITFESQTFNIISHSQQGFVNISQY